MPIKCSFSFISWMVCLRTIRWSTVALWHYCVVICFLFRLIFRRPSLSTIIVWMLFVIWVLSIHSRWLIFRGGGGGGGDGFTLPHISYFAFGLAGVRLLSLKMFVRLFPFIETVWGQFPLLMSSLAYWSPQLVLFHSLPLVDWFGCSRMC